MAFDSFTYPMTLDYLAQSDSTWSDWEVVRELVQNAQDTETEWELHMDGDTLVVRDYGKGIFPRHFLLGVSEKSNKDPRGQYAEGLKLALLVLTRMGLTANIRSNGLRAWNTTAIIKTETEPAVYEEHKVMKIEWETGLDFFEGAEIRVPHWEHDLFANRFLRTYDPRILATAGENNLLLDEKDPSIYVRDIYVCPANIYGDDCAFGYNLTDVQLNRDRAAIESWDIAKGMGKVWNGIGSVELLVSFFKAVEDGAGEQWTRWNDYSPKHTVSIGAAAKIVWGSNVVVKTDDLIAHEAEYQGAHPVQFKNGIGAILCDIIGTDFDYLEKKGIEKHPIKKDSALDPEQRKTLYKLRTLSKRITGYREVKIVAATMDGQTLATYKDNLIKISLHALENRERATSSFLHEMAHHTSPACDATAEMVHAVQRVSAKIINSYTYRG